MIRLDLSSAPKWLDLGTGLRLQVLPVTTAIMVAARNDPAVEAQVSCFPSPLGQTQAAAVAIPVFD